MDIDNANRCVAFIPIRGGSKSIPRKNVKPINGRPLVYWVLDAATQCNLIDSVIVSTDDEEIKKTVLDYNSLSGSSHKVTCFDRSQSTATDSATTESAMVEYAVKHDFDTMVLIQATSPLLEADNLEEAIKIYQESEYDSLLSVVKQKRFIWDKGDDGYLPLNYNYEERPRRQEFEGYYVENGAFYITEKSSLLKSNNRISGNIGIYEMAEETYYEIDELSDWIIVENLLKNRNKEKNYNIKLFVSDCDGVLTDGGMYYSDNGDALKKFNTKDGMGFSLLKEKGIKTAIITGENSKIVEARAKKLNIDYLYKGVTDKKSILNEIIKKENISASEVAYVGDDINDIECLEMVGIGFSVSDAVPSARNAANIILQHKGGDGAVREAIDRILNS